MALRSPAPLMPDFGRYQVLDKLGEGAMGVVYRAKDPAIGRVVALKLLSEDIGQERELHQRFEREAEAIGRLNHPNVVTVYDVGQVDGQLYMAMELLEGSDLRALIERRAALAVADKVRILVQICEGLGYAHSRGVVHRDVKPANVFVTSSGRVKILDFGLARLTTRETITRKGVILGTPDYMSPEHATGRPVDHRSDMFSAGSVLYEFLCLEKPFKGKTLHSVLFKIIQESPDPLVTVWPELPIRLAAIVDRMLQKEPENRFGSMPEAARALQEVHAALRRSGGRSARPLPPLAPSEDARSRVREHLARGRAHFEAGRMGEAAASMRDALALDPANEDAAEALWRLAQRTPEPPSRRATALPSNEARVGALLKQAAPGRSEDEARGALAELALLAPDDARVLELLRLRAGRD